MGGRFRSYTLVELLASRTVKGPSCWEVQGYVLHNGYVQIKRQMAHRIAWEAVHGPVENGLKVCHSCDNPRCVNPAHLFVASQHDNIRDCIVKARRNAFGRQKLAPEAVLDVRARLARGELQKDIARRYHVARNTVSGIATGATWSWLQSADTLAQIRHRLDQLQQQARHSGVSVR